MRQQYIGRENLYMPKDTHNRMPNGGSISESLVLSLLLSFSGGFQDAIHMW